MTSKNSTTKTASNWESTLPGNVKLDVTGNILTITVDLSKKGTRSASGKSEVIGSTHGNVSTPDGVSIGLNVYRRAA
jgi:hypothetical protein